MKLMADHGKLQRVFTQNIDTLELAAGIPRDKIVFAHGSFDTQSCIECKTSAPRIELEQKVMRGEVARCHACNGLVKPDIVFFGESLPEEFFQKRTEIENADLVIVMGSSLSVYPFAGLPMSANEDTPRILMNMDRVGDIGCRKEDVVWLGECDDGVRELAEYLGWDKELDKIWRFHKGWKESDDGGVDDKEPKPLDDAALEKEVERLTGEVEKSLKVAEDHKSWVEGKLEKEDSEKKKNDGGESSGPSSAAPVPTATATSTAPAPTPQQQPPIETKDEEKEATPPLPAQEVLNKSEL